MTAFLDGLEPVRIRAFYRRVPVPRFSKSLDSSARAVPALLGVSAVNSLLTDHSVGYTISSSLLLTGDSGIS